MGKTRQNICTFAAEKGTNMRKIIGRSKEIALLEQYIQSDQAEFIALYGRRRVGKTFLINSLFADNFAFSMTGVIDGETSEQMEAFVESLAFYGHELSQTPTSWMKAFAELRKFLQPKIDENAPVILFFDEIPCLDTQRSGFVRALGYFWNSWASLHDNIKLIVCGSATSWMIKNIIDAKGGLHNRITHEICLHQFTLGETEKYLTDRGFPWNRLSFLQCYMTFGGVAYYLSLLDPQESLVQNIDRLFFNENAELRREYDRLLKTLFNSVEPYKKIVKLLADNKKGLTRSEISSHSSISGSTLTTMLDNLQNCEFIRLYYVREKKVKNTGGIYKLTDFYTMFYLNFVPKAKAESNFWSNHINTPEVNNWFGLTFENICLAHIPQIKETLHLDRISTQCYSWRSKTSTPGAQIDLIIDRADNMINLCEIKYSKDEYKITQEDDKLLRNRMTAFRNETGTRSGIYLTMITTYGFTTSIYNETVPVKLNMDCLFG